jgi:hypothetical protein
MNSPLAFSCHATLPPLNATARNGRTAICENASYSPLAAISCNVGPSLPETGHVAG